MAEILITAGMFLFVGLLLLEAISGMLWLFLFMMTAAFIFSWHIQGKSLPYFSWLIGLSITAVIIWMLLEAYNSSAGYKEAVAIEIKGLFVLSAIFSFGSFDARLLSFLRILSIMLLICSPVFIKVYAPAQYLIIFAYLVFWALIARIKFCEWFEIPPDKWLFRSHIPLIIIATSLGLAAVFFLSFPIKPVIPGGFLYFEEQYSLTTIEKKYSQLLDKMLKLIPESLVKVGYNQDISSAPLFLNNLVKDPGAVKEVARAEIVLLSLLRTAGAGIEKQEDKNEILLLREFVDTKAVLNFERFKKDFLQRFKEGAFFNLKERRQVASVISQMESSESVEDVEGYARQLNSLIENIRFDSLQKQDVQRLADNLQAWKLLQLRREWDSPLAKKKEVKPHGSGAKRQKQDKEPPAENITYTPNLFKPRQTTAQKSKTASIILFIFCFLFLILAAIALALYLITKGRIKKILSLYEDNPSAFIIGIYFNIKDILEILGSFCKNTITPLNFARAVENKYSLKNNLFLRLSVRFEEAKYSGHHLGKKDSQAMLADYNNFIKDIFGRLNAVSIFYVYCAALIRTRPTFI
ncbi:MAG: hypothetical protein NC923_03430 [Candidatus Omnitrophica bacterium]|nr:hypothetical protein [Candidatus Omnitrophota bacterium]